MKDELTSLLLEIDRIWSHVPTSLLEDDQWSSSKAREETAKVVQSYCDKQNKELLTEVSRLNAELMDDDPFHTIQTYATNEDAIYTQRSADDWKRMHNRVYQMLLSLEKQNQELREFAKKVVEKRWSSLELVGVIDNISDYLTKTK